MTTKRQNILGMPLEDLVSFFNEIDEKDYRAKQLMQWIYAKHIFNFDLMTNFNLELRSHLNQNCSLDFDAAMQNELSEDGTQKWLIGKKDNQIIETVFIPEDKRGTLCISSQVGCLIDCPFCATGHQGFNRNLSSSEIIGQVLLARGELDEGRLTNIVFMGMGEPTCKLP